MLYGDIISYTPDYDIHYSEESKRSNPFLSMEHILKWIF